MRVASKVGNLPSKFGHARPLGSRIIRYVRDGRSDGRTDGQKQRIYIAPFPMDGSNGGGECTGCFDVKICTDAKKLTDVKVASLDNASIWSEKTCEVLIGHWRSEHLVCELFRDEYRIHF